MLQQRQYAAAIRDYRKDNVTFVHANTNDILSYTKDFTMDKMAQNSICSYISHNHPQAVPPKIFINVTMRRTDGR